MVGTTSYTSLEGVMSLGIGIYHTTYIILVNVILRYKFSVLIPAGMTIKRRILEAKLEEINNIPTVYRDTG